MITADQLLAHVVGDYVLQSDWMAKHKTHSWIPAIAHVIVYTLPFLVVSRSPLALCIIAVSHLVIDRWRLARHVARLGNLITPSPHRSWAECKATGYAPDRPAWMVGWLLVIVDNTMHVLINGWALALR